MLEDSFVIEFWINLNEFWINANAKRIRLKVNQKDVAGSNLTEKKTRKTNLNHDQFQNESCYNRSWRFASIELYLLQGRV